MGENNPEISVLLPVHNGGSFLACAVESILGQTFEDYELITIDDGSTDESLEVLRAFERRDARVRLVSRDRTGYVVALNEMIGMARGGLLARMDADDVAHPGRFRQQVKFMREHSEVVCVGSGFDIIDDRSCRLTRLMPPGDDSAIQELLLKGHTAICHPSAMMRVEAVRAVGGYDVAVTSVEDLDLFLKLGEIGKLANLPRSLMRYRIHSRSVSGIAGQRQRELGRGVCERAWKRRGIEDGEFEAGEPWRPGPERSSRHEFALQYGWWAFNSGESRTALRYGARAIGMMPWRKEGWGLLGSAAVKPRAWPRSVGAGQEEQKPIVTVLMPMYNAEAYLREAVESVLEQSLEELELVVVDDGSTDDSPLLLREYAKNDSRVRIVGQERSGYVAALNHGLDVARGRFIARMDADDVCDLRRLELQVERMEREPELVALGSCAKAIDPRGRALGNFDVPLSHEELEAAHLGGDSSIHHPAVMMRREALERVGRYRIGFAPAEDFDLWLRLGEVGRLGNLAERLISKRLTRSGVVGSTLRLQEQVVSAALADAWERRGLAGEPPRRRRTIQSTGDLYRQWGWLAVRSQSLSAARIYAARSIMIEPLHEHSWRLAYCALRGR